MTERVQLKHVMIDHNFYRKPKILSLIYRYKAEGVVLFQMILCDMAGATDGEIDDDCIRAEGALIGWDEARTDEFIKYCLERNMFHRGSKPFLISNRRIQADQENMAKKQNEWRDKKRLQRATPKTNEGQTGDKIKTHTGPVKSELLNYEDLNYEESKKTAKLKFPPTLETPECRDALARWIVYLRTNHAQDLDFLAVDALLMSYNTRPVEFVENVLYTISSGRWRSVQVKPRDSKAATGPPKETFQQRCDRLSKEAAKQPLQGIQ